MAKKLAFLLCCLFFSPIAAQGQDCLPNGDLNCDSGLSPADIVLLINKVLINQALCDESRGDLNCDGYRDAADIWLLINCAFSGFAPLGACPIPDVRPTSSAPEDSIIVETKRIAQGAGEGAGRVRVWMTNKDTIAAALLPLREVSVSGGAYLTLNRVVRADTAYPVAYPDTQHYDNSSPDSIPIFGASGSLSRQGYLLPSSTRQAVWEIVFDTVKLSPGVCEGEVGFDSLPLFYEATIQFVDKYGRRVPVNFVPGVVTVVSPTGDRNNDGELSPADVVLMLNCVFLAEGSCELCYSDLNCDGQLSPSDVVIELNAVFLAEPIACS